MPTIGKSVLHVTPPKVPVKELAELAKKVSTGTHVQKAVAVKTAKVNPKK